ncbi:hypothetical protein ACHAXT_000473 [Thalassiosira profunda]
MNQVNAVYADRVGGVLDDAIESLKAVSEDGAEVANGLEALKAEATDTLRLTCQEAASLRSDVCRFGVEEGTKNDDLVKLEAKLRDMREERQERRDELESERDELKIVFEDKSKTLLKKQAATETSEQKSLEAQRSAFDEERKALDEKTAALSKQYDEQRRRYDEEESRMREKISSLTTDIQELTNEHETAMAAKQAEMESVRSDLKEQTTRRQELTEHFARVDLDNLAKEEEEEKLRVVRELNENADKVLDDGATALQRLWRGIKERAAIAKMRSKKKKGKGKAGAKKKQK